MKQIHENKKNVICKSLPLGMTSLSGPVVFKNVYKNTNLKMLIISYKFANKLISGASLGPKIKAYYENNARGLVQIALSYFTVEVPFNYNTTVVNKAVDICRQKMPKNFDMFIHFCNPKVSHTGNSNAITYASYVNCIHETGHAFGLGHANTKQYNPNGTFTVLHCRDPFDQMTSFMSYPSTNSVHRHQLGWFAPGEAVYAEMSKTYTLAMLKDFGNMTSTKVLYWTFVKNGTKFNYWISYGTFQNQPRIVLHSSDPSIKYSYLEGIYGLDRTVVHRPSGLQLTITSNPNPKFVTVTVGSVNDMNPMTVPDNTNDVSLVLNDAYANADNPDEDPTEDHNDCDVSQ